MGNADNHLNELLDLAEKQGYLTFDDILDISEEYGLSVSEVDDISEKLSVRGILIYEEEPDIAESSDNFIDYGQADYERLYEEIVKRAPGMTNLIDYIKSVRPAQKREVRPLLLQAKEGNDYAKSRLIDIHMRAALRIAFSEADKRNYDLEDTIIVSFTGIQNAIEKYDPSSFSTIQSYVAMWVRAAIQRECKPLWVESYYPTHVMDKIYILLSKLEDNGFDIYRGDLPDGEMLRNIIKDDEVLPSIEHIIPQVMNELSGKISIEGTLDNWRSSANRRTVYDELMELSYDNVTSVVELEMLRTEITKALEVLTDRERDVIKKRYGLTGKQEMTLEEVGEDYGLTRERIRQIESKALRKLSQPKRKDKLIDFYYTNWD